MPTTNPTAIPEKIKGVSTISNAVMNACLQATATALLAQSSQILSLDHFIGVLPGSMLPRAKARFVLISGVLAIGVCNRAAGFVPGHPASTG